MKHGKPLIILLAYQVILTPASAEYTGPSSGARRYSYEVEVPGTCHEDYNCCTWWSDTPCGDNPWDIGCCMEYGTCTRDYKSVSVELDALGNGTHSISFTLTDNAGNVYDSADDPNVGIITFSVDSEPPAVVHSKPDV